MLEKKEKGRVVDPIGAETEILAGGDQVAAELLSWLAPLRFTEAADDREREAAYRLRARAVVSAGMKEPAPFADGVERDAFDDDAVQILGWDDAGPIATCRLVLPASGRSLPLEETFGSVGEMAALNVAAGATQADEAVGRAVEWGRVAVDSSLRGQGGRIFMGLAARGWLSMRARGFSTGVGITPRKLVTLFRALGFPVTVLGPPKLHWGIERVPILCLGPEAVRALEQLWREKDSSAMLGS